MINFIFVELWNKTKAINFKWTYNYWTLLHEKSQSYMAIHLIDPVQLLTMSLKKWLIKTLLTPTVQHSLNGTQTQLTLIKNTRQNKHYLKVSKYTFTEAY
jgi:hypothetical protein